MTLTEHIHRRQQAEQARKVEAVRLALQRNAEIRRAHADGADGYGATRSLTPIERREATRKPGRLQRLWARLAAKFQGGIHA